MKPAHLVLTSILLLGALSGCVQDHPPAEPTPTDPHAIVLDPIPAEPLEQDHETDEGHSDPAFHNASANMDRVGYHSGYGNGHATDLPAGQGFSELFVRDGLAFLGRRGGADGGFVILNVSDPAHPQRLSAFQGLANYDMESTHDNRFVFFVSQYLNNQQPSSVPPDDSGEAPRGIHIIDIADPSAPVEISGGYYPVPTRGAHTITYYRTEAGRELVAAQTYDFLPDPSLGLPVAGAGINPASQRVLLFDFLRAPAPRLQLLSTFEQHPTDVPLEMAAFPHDVSIQKHPVTSDLIMYVAYWNIGAFLVDINDPTQPKILSRLNDFSPSVLKEIHLAAPADTLIDGIHLTVTEPEIEPAPESGQYTFFDTTDPRAPKRLGSWELPGDIQNADGLRFSPHNFEVENGTLYLAHYHAGVWVVDVHNLTLLETPQTLGFVQPNEPRPGWTGDTPNVWTALYDGGYVYASDVSSGLYIYHYRGEPWSHHADEDPHGGSHA